MDVYKKARLFFAGVILMTFGLYGCTPTATGFPSPVIATKTAAGIPAAGTTVSPIPSSTRSSTLNPVPTSSPTSIPSVAPSPSPTPSQPIRAIRLDFPDYAESRAGMNDLETRLRQSGINLVALGAGRVEWTYFKWAGRPENWSGDVANSGIDFLAEDATRFHAWARVDAVIDVYAPKFIEAHPETAAISWLGKPSPYLVNTMDLVDGDFGRLLLEMIIAIIANYPVDSISLTELMYYTDGYGEIDKAAFMAYSGKKDWPRLSNGLINIDHPSIGEWRSQEITRFLQKAQAITTRYGKQLYVDAAVSWGAAGNLGVEHGTRYDILLGQADRVVVWNYFALNGYEPDYSKQLAQVLSQAVGDRAIMSIGLWDKGGTSITPSQLETSILASQQGGMQDLWITPSSLMTAAHWEVLGRLWGSP